MTREIKPQWHPVRLGGLVNHYGFALVCIGTGLVIAYAILFVLALIFGE